MGQLPQPAAVAVKLPLHWQGNGRYNYYGWCADMLYMSCLICYVIWYSTVITLSAYYVTDRSQYAEFAEQGYFNQPIVLLNEGPLPERAESCFSISKYHVLASMILFPGSGRWKSIMTDYTKKHEPYHRKWRSIIVRFLEP